MVFVCMSVVRSMSCSWYGANYDVNKEVKVQDYSYSKSSTESPRPAQTRRCSYLEAESNALRMSQKVGCVEAALPTTRSRWFSTCIITMCVLYCVWNPSWFGCKRPWACQIHYSRVVTMPAHIFRIISNREIGLILLRS